MVVLASVLFFGSVGVASAQGIGLLTSRRTEQAAPPPPPPAAPPANGRRIEYSVSGQRVSLFEADGRQVSSYSVSGRRGIPRPGTYHVFSKSRVSRSGSLRLDHMVRFVPGKKAIGFHAIPTTRDGTPIQGEEELGQFRSAGCVRQSPAHAAFLFEWAPIGTEVIVSR